MNTRLTTGFTVNIRSELLITQKSYKKGANAHTNSIEGFWSTIKRGVCRIYHHVSKKHLQLYVNEFVFRYHNRKNGGMFDLVLAEVQSYSFSEYLFCRILKKTSCLFSHSLIRVSIGKT
jgi:hypothetical protein